MAVDYSLRAFDAGWLTWRRCHHRDPHGARSESRRDRLAPGHYLVETAAAIEITLLHNFAWHVRYRWRDRRDRSAVVVRLLRFHLANGPVSFIGNVALMRVLVGQAHLPVLAANGIAIACCSIVNFALSDLCEFAGVRPRWA
ncbi:MAG TPA: GtrA family protein [Terracidiphilus sp.]|nr:GtrA family protein [Terracidiphilus sp.]